MVLKDKHQSEKAKNKQREKWREKYENGYINPFYGKHHTEESKNKQRTKWREKYENGFINPWKGKKPSEETRQKMRETKKDYIPWNKGKSQLNTKGDSNPSKRPEVRKKISEKLKGRIFSEEHRKNISNSRWGEDNPAWANGASFYPYSPQFNRKLKHIIAERDNYICQLCKKEHPKDPNIHHWNYNKKEINPFYLIYTCRKCNARLNYHREHWIKFFYDYQIKRGLIPFIWSNY